MFHWATLGLFICSPITHGAALLSLAAATPYLYNLRTASAIQASQVYTMAAHYALLAIGVLLAGILIEISVVASKN
jgi:hypothetical protein